MCNDSNGSFRSTHTRWRGSALATRLGALAFGSQRWVPGRCYGAWRVSAGGEGKGRGELRLGLVRAVAPGLRIDGKHSFGVLVPMPHFESLWGKRWLDATTVRAVAAAAMVARRGTLCIWRHTWRSEHAIASTPTLQHSGQCQQWQRGTTTHLLWFAVSSFLLPHEHCHWLQRHLLPLLVALPLLGCAC